LVPGAARPFSGREALTEAPSAGNNVPMRFLKILRQLLKLSRSELSRESGVSVRELARIEDDGHIPRAPVIGKIDRAIRCEVDRRIGVPVPPPEQGDQ